MVFTLGSSVSAETPSIKNTETMLLAQASPKTQANFDSAAAAITKTVPTVGVIPQDSVVNAVKTAVVEAQKLKGASLAEIIAFASLVLSLILTVIGFFIHKNVKSLLPKS